MSLMSHSPEPRIRCTSPGTDFPLYGGKERRPLDVLQDNLPLTVKKSLLRTDWDEGGQTVPRVDVDDARAADLFISRPGCGPTGTQMSLTVTLRVWPSA